MLIIILKRVVRVVNYNKNDKKKKGKKEPNLILKFQRNEKRIGFTNTRDVFFSHSRLCEKYP